MNKSIVFIVFSLVMVISVEAGGKTEKHSISDPSGFKETIDIDGKKPGRYNFYVEADDKGANTQIAGPNNIFIDPESDLPVVMITNPSANMRLPGNLNVVGTCVDDDAVDYVELTFSNDPSTVVRAEGKEFWSYYLDTKEMEDGLYTITVTGVDINGLRGRSKKVSWNLDRRQPVITVDNIAPGGLIHGKVTLKGAIWDGNGAASLSFSAKDDAPFTNIPIKTDKKTKTTAYSATLDTKAFADGPLKIRFKAVDKQGTAGIYTHLVFVDNTPPVVAVVYPDKPVNGVFTAAGYVQDVIGLESLSWKIGKGASDLAGAVSGNFELTLGNIWWTKEFKILDNKAKFVELEITAKDLSGNIVSKKQRIAVNASDDLPVVSLSSPTANQIIDGTGFVIRGTADDDDGVDSIFYAIDGNIPVEIQTTGIKTTSGEFHIAAPNLASGSHTLEVWAKDISGVEGIKQRVTGIVIAGEKPSIRIVQTQIGGVKNAVTKLFYSGIELQSETETYFIAEVSGDSPIQSVAYQFGGLAPKQAKLTPPKSAGNPTIAEIPLPADVDFGLVPLVIKAADIARSADKNAAKNGVSPVQRETTSLDYIIVTDLSSAHLQSLKDASHFVINDAHVQKEASAPSARAVETPVEGQTDGEETGADEPVESEASAITNRFIFVGDYPLAGYFTGSDVKDIATERSYRFDTKILKDGTHVVFIKVWDKYDIIGLYSNLINIDNTPPTLTIERPLDGTSSVGQVSVSGQATDGISLQNVVIGIRSTEGVPIPDHLASFVREPDSILIETLDISALPDGLYSLDIQATDRAGNITRASRYIELAKEKNPNFIEVLYPMNGETVQGQFNLYGYVGGADKASYVSLELNGTEVDIASVTNAGYFRFTLDENTGLVPDTNIIVIKSDFNGRGETISYPRMIEYKRTGPWITIDTLAMGDYAYQRPYLRGLTGYALSEDDRDALADKKASKTAKAQVEAKTPAFVEISFDDGKTFRPAAMKKKGAWEYRIEDWDMEQGMYYLLIKAVMKNGETAVTKTLVQINKTPPVITLISPKTGGRYNQTIDFTGIVTDDVEVNSAHFVLRSGSKESYEVPGFMQGMYLDGHFLGGTLWDIGAGLSFFDDNVKLQFQYGQFTKEQYAAFGENNPRFYGNTFGLKLLAGVYALNFGSFGGPDWRWLGLSVSIGANFSYFTETQSGSPTILPALLMQLEFPKISIPKMKMFRNVSVYAEPQLWFVSTDAEVETTGVETILFRITGGLRIYVF